MSIIFTYLEQNYADNIYWIFYGLNLFFGAIAFELGFAKKLPILKKIIIYILLAIGTWIITIFSIFGLPMTESLIIIAIVLGIYRFRLYNQRKHKQQNSSH